jgi:hypothetical protein
VPEFVRNYNFRYLNATPALPADNSSCVFQTPHYTYSGPTLSPRVTTTINSNHQYSITTLLACPSTNADGASSPACHSKPTTPRLCILSLFTYNQRVYSAQEAAGDAAAANYTSVRNVAVDILVKDGEMRGLDGWVEMVIANERMR